MKYMNSLVFLSLMLLVAGCQKKEQPSSKAMPDKKKGAHHTSAKDAKAMRQNNEKSAPSSSVKASADKKKTGPTMLETKKSVAKKDDMKKAPVAKKVMSADKKAMPKKAAPANKAKKDNVKVQSTINNNNPE